MPSLRLRLVNALLRHTVRPRWRPGIDIAEIRAHAAKMDGRLARRPPPVESEATLVGGVPARWYGEPQLAAGRAPILFVHGGAWCMHLPALYGAFAARLCRRTGRRVLLVEYRLAPEHPHPAAVDDCKAAYRALLAERGAPAAILGDSAGGSLSLVTLMRARDEGLSLPMCGVLLSPSTDLTGSGASTRYNEAADPMFNAAAMELLAPVYCPGQAREAPLLSPLFGAWHGLPPLYFLAGSTEMLLDDSIRAQDRAVQAGTSAHVDVWPLAPHDFPLFGFLPEARDALGRIAAFIAAHAGE